MPGVRRRGVRRSHHSQKPIAISQLGHATIAGPHESMNDSGTPAASRTRNEIGPRIRLMITEYMSAALRSIQRRWAATSPPTIARTPSAVNSSISEPSVTLDAALTGPNGVTVPIAMAASPTGSAHAT
ncbi:hypothetical protein AXK59_22075 [Tsukamurella tyrosinosolvens]|nr:hypothetical protein AXK59_22075 [Tsukamurella tyrosinosolvens]KZL94936.1 hypothetical protein AXX05_09915 [Tsukamurella tyrosinosolvens]